MSRASRLTKIAATVALTVAVTGGIAVASSSDHGTPAPEVRRAPAIAAADTITQSGYVALAPCRIVSTIAAGGKYAAGKSRSFFAGGGTGFLPQGGKSGGCGVPIGASAIAVSVTATRETKHGYFTLFADGTNRPLASQVSYSVNQNTTALVNVPLNPTSGKFAVFSSAPSDVLVDIAGYYREPIAVTISSGGTILSQSGQITGVTHTSGSGTYTVNFSVNVAACAMSATTLGSNYNPGITVLLNRTSVAVFIRALDKSTTSSVYGDTDFSLTVTC